jgi:hypothetical protein
VLTVAKQLVAGCHKLYSIDFNLLIHRIIIMSSKHIILVALLVAWNQCIQGFLRGAMPDPKSISSQRRFLDGNDLSLELFTAVGIFVITTSDHCHTSLSHTGRPGSLFADKSVSVLRYKLGHCIPDPLGQAAAVKVVADVVGNVVLMTFNDTTCEKQRSITQLNQSFLGKCTESKFYEIQQQRPPSPAMFTKDYYFDEKCEGPHSEVQIVASTYCWNDPFSGQSHRIHLEYNWRMWWETSLQSASIETFSTPDCHDPYMARFNEPSKLPGYASCVKQGAHYVHTILGGVGSGQPDANNAEWN